MRNSTHGIVFFLFIFFLYFFFRVRNYVTLCPELFFLYFFKKKILSGITSRPELRRVQNYVVSGNTSCVTHTHTQCAVTELPLFHCSTNCSLSLSLFSPILDREEGQDPASASNDVFGSRGGAAVGGH